MFSSGFISTVGYQRELNYRHNDGSYSAWGGSDGSGSLWSVNVEMILFDYGEQCHVT